MDFSTRYPEYASVEEYVRRAHAERSVHLAHLLADGIEWIWQEIKAVVASVNATIEARAKEARQDDLFLKRAVHRY
jgi:hypothetical protein